MTLEQGWSIVRKQWKLILLCTIVVAGATFGVSKLITPMYQSSVLLQVSSNTSSMSQLGGLFGDRDTIQTQAQLVVSDPVLQEVLLQYQDLTLRQLQQRASAVAKANTQLVQVTVQDPDPQRAASLANDISAIFIRQNSSTLQEGSSRPMQMAESEMKITQRKIDDMAKKIAAIDGQPNKKVDVQVLQVQLQDLQRHYAAWDEVQVQLQLLDVQSGASVRVVEPALPAEDPEYPRISLNTGMGAAAGLLLGVMLVLLYSQLDTHIRTPEALSQITGWPLLATLRKVKGKYESDEKGLLGHATNVEPYRILRTNIGSLSRDRSLRTLVVTSALPEEGKSAVAANLALSMAKTGKITLLVDADLRRPSQHKIFQVENTCGLSDILASQCKDIAPQQPMSKLAGLEKYIQTVQNPNLFIIPAGQSTADPPELLDSGAMRQLTQMIEFSKADVVIFDTPPLLGLSDAKILVSKVDGVVMVTDLALANKHIVKNANTILAQSEASVVGCVVNRLNQKEVETY